MTPERLAEIKARCEAATPGPWASSAFEDDLDFGAIRADGFGCPVCGDYGPPREEDTRFIAHARTDVPDLVAEVERLRAALELARIEGHESGDGTGFDCPALYDGGTCSCGSDEHNAQIDAALRSPTSPAPAHPSPAP